MTGWPPPAGHSDHRGSHVYFYIYPGQNLLASDCGTTNEGVKKSYPNSG